MKERVHCVYETIREKEKFTCSSRGTGWLTSFCVCSVSVREREREIGVGSSRLGKNVKNMSRPKVMEREKEISSAVYL